MHKKLDSGKLVCLNVGKNFIITSPKLVIFGTGANAEIAYDYFTNESSYEVVAFTVERKYLGGVGNTHFQGLPVIPFELIEDHYLPQSYQMFVAVGYLKLNHVRTRIYRKAKKKGYKLATFISPYAYVGRNVEIGDNCFIQEHNNIQYGTRIGNNVFVWASNHIGHHSVLRDNVFVASQVVISGHCDIGRYTFIGSGAAFANNIEVGANCLIGVGTNVSKNLEDETLYADKMFAPAGRIGDLRGKSKEMFYPW